MRRISDCESPISANTRIDKFFIKNCGADSLEYLELQFALEKEIGIRITDADWEYLSGSRFCKTKEDWEARYAQFFTFGRLADLIAERCDIGRIEPITILGSTSLAAGAFRAIERIAKNHNPNIKEFAPSTTIAERLSVRELPIFWARMRALSSHRVPPWESVSISRVAERVESQIGAPLCLALSTGLAILWCLTNGIHRSLGWIGMIALSLFLGLVLSSIPALIMLIACKLTPTLFDMIPRKKQVLPKDIQTFGDLARLIAGDRGGWCESCGYDLTGLRSDSCPECGIDCRDMKIGIEGQASPQ